MMASLQGATIDPTAAAALPGLAARLRDATRTLHREAERAGAMGALLRRESDVAAYAALLGNLHAIYAALEEALDRHAGDAAFDAFGFAALRRAPALAADLQALGATAVPLQPATTGYVERVRSVAARRPPALFAHAYVRYLGDLNGGRVLRRVIGDSLGLDAGTLQFYDFGSADVAALEQRFRRALAALTLDAAAGDELVEEARWSFAQHVLLFEQLQDVSSRRMRA